MNTHSIKEFFGALICGRSQYVRLELFRFLKSKTVSMSQIGVSGAVWHQSEGNAGDSCNAI